MKNPTNSGSWCSIADLTSSASYKWLVMELSRLKSLLLIALWVFLLFKYFVTVCRLRSMICYPQELLAKIFIVSANTLELGFSSPCLRAMTADCTKLLKHFLGVYWTNWWLFYIQEDPDASNIMIREWW